MKIYVAHISNAIDEYELIKMTPKQFTYKNEKGKSSTASMTNKFHKAFFVKGDARQWLIRKIEKEVDELKKQIKEKEKLIDKIRIL